MIRVVETVRIYSKLNNQVSLFVGVCTFCLPNSVLLIEAISKVMTDRRHLWQPVYRAPLARYFVCHWQKWLKGSCQEMRFYLLPKGVEQSWQQQHLHLAWDGLDQDKWNYVFLPFCQAPYLSESMQLSPTRGEREEMWAQSLQVNSNWTLSTFLLSLEQSETSSWLEENLA